MRIADYFRLSLGNIARAKLRTSLTIFAVVIGATSVTIMLALVTGAKDYVKQQYAASGTLQQVIVTQQTDLDYNNARHGGGGGQGTGVVLNDAMVNKVKSVAHVTAVTPEADVHVLDAISYNGQKLTAQKGTAYDANGVIKHTVLAGRDFLPSDGDNTIVITDDYAKKFGFAGNLSAIVGKQVDLITQGFYTGPGAVITPPQQNQGPQQGPQPQQQPNNPTTLHATVVGVTSGSDDGPTIYFPLSWAKKLLTDQRYEVTQADMNAQAQQNTNNNHLRPGQQAPAPVPTHMTLVSSSELDQSGYQTIIAQTDSTKSVAAAANTIRTFGVGAATAASFVQQQLTVFNIVGLVLGGIGGIALLVSAIGVVNTMVMAILERTREIGVMRAVGATRAHVRRLFTFEAALLGFAGGVFGIGIGYILTKVANHALNGQFASSGITKSNIITLPLWLIAAVIGTTTAIGFMAGLLPAGRAARLNPVEALRYE